MFGFILGSSIIDRESAEAPEAVVTLLNPSFSSSPALTAIYPFVAPVSWIHNQVVFVLQGCGF
jgi:hypothetical protein